MSAASCLPFSKYPQNKCVFHLIIKGRPVFYLGSEKRHFQDISIQGTVSTYAKDSRNGGIIYIIYTIIIYINDTLVQEKSRLKHLMWRI